MTTFREGAPTPVVVLAIESRVLGIDPGTGEVRWEHNLASASSTPTALLITPNRVFAAANNTLCCLEYPSGTLLWKAEIPKGRGVLLLDGGRLFVSSSSGKLECYTLDGQRLWQNPLKGKGLGAVAIGVPGNVVQADEYHA